MNASEPRVFKYYDLIMAAFVCVLLCANLIGAAKQAQMTLPFVGTVTYGADLFFFPAADTPFMAVYQPQLEAVFGNTWRIAAGSMIAFACGSFANSFVLAKMKIATQGRFLWARIVGSTVVGQLVDTGVFFLIAFYGIWANEQLFAVILTQYLFKTAWEAVMYPVTARVVAFLKRAEGVDFYDRPSMRGLSLKGQPQGGKA